MMLWEFHTRPGAGLLGWCWVAWTVARGGSPPPDTIHSELGENQIRKKFIFAFIYVEFLKIPRKLRLLKNLVG